MLTKESRRARAQLASTASKAARRPDDAETAQAVEEARRNYRFVAASDYIRAVVDAAPPLTPEQRDRLATLLRGVDRRNGFQVGGPDGPAPTSTSEHGSSATPTRPGETAVRNVMRSTAR